MPRLAAWSAFPPALRRHLSERMRDRAIPVEGLFQVKLWVEAQPEVPEGEWFRDFGSFKLCGKGKFPLTFLLPGQPATGKKL